MTIGYLGKPGDHSDQLAALVQPAGLTLSVLADSSTIRWQNASRSPSFRRLSSAWHRMLRFERQVAGKAPRDYLVRVLEQLIADNIECVIGCWGTNVLGDVAAIKRAQPGVRAFLNVLCHPTGLSGLKVASQNWLFRRHIRCCDGLIVSSIVMQSYLQEYVLKGVSMPCLVWPPFLAESYHPRERLPECGQTELFPNPVDRRAN